MEKTHFGQHGAECFGCKLSSIQFGNVEAPPQRAVEARLERDLPAYRRLRQQGLQPKATRGAAELETRAESQWEIEHGRIVAPAVQSQMFSAMADAQHAVQEGEARAKSEGYDMNDIREWKKKKSAA